MTSAMAVSGFLDVEGRRKVLREMGARGDDLTALLEYNRNRFDAERFENLPPLPLPDEPHLEVWREYADEAAREGAVAVLRKALVQLSFPVEEGISQTGAYRAATRRGEWPFDARRPDLMDEEGVRLEIEPTAAGSVPILTVSHRDDFETLVRVFSARNEPVPVPRSMGACIVTGFNNWDRIARYRSSWTASRPEASESEWSEEFRRLIPQKELYQDRFIILSSGPYSNVDAASVGYAQRSWTELSGSIRRRHEATHYFTYRLLGSMRNNVVDEIMADYAGLVATFGRFDRRLALIFLGLESYPSYRSGGRLENYLGEPPLDGGAREVLYHLAHEAVENLERFDETLGEDRDELSRARAVLAIAALTLEELAHGDSPVHLSRTMKENGEK